jgi:hypothetical protein
MGLSMLAQSPPLDHIQPTGEGYHFRFTRPQSRDQSSRPSTASGRANPTNNQESEDETESDEESTQEIERPARRVEHAEFELEELDSDPDYDGDIEVVQPDHFEDARSDKSASDLDGNEILDRLKDLRCDSSDEEDQQSRYLRKKKRWSQGKFKRTHSESIEGDSSYSDNDPLDDVDSSARRLRRRVRGPNHRSSLIFEDKGYSNANNIIEVEEPDDGHGIPHTQGPPSIPSDDGFTLDDWPFWFVEDPMDVEEESS